MKRQLIVVLLILMVIGLSGCSEKEEPIIHSNKYVDLIVYHTGALAVDRLIFEFKESGNYTVIHKGELIFSQYVDEVYTFSKIEQESLRGTSIIIKRNEVEILNVEL